MYSSIYEVYDLMNDYTIVFNKYKLINSYIITIYKTVDQIHQNTSVSTYIQPMKQAPSNDILKQQLSFQCSLCLQQYNNQAKYPMIICTNQHTYCLYCVNNIVFKTGNQSKCPECKLKILKSNMIKNRILNNIKENTQSNIKKQEKYVQIFQQSNLLVQGVIQSNILKLKITTKPTKRTSTDSAQIDISKLYKDKQSSPRAAKQLLDMQVKFKKEVDDLKKKLASQQTEYIKQIAKLCDENDKLKASNMKQQQNNNNKTIAVIRKQEIKKPQKPMPAPSYKPAPKQEQVVMISSRSQRNLILNSNKNVEMSLELLGDKIKSNPVKSIIWVDTKSQYEKKITLNNNMITCIYPDGVNVFGNISLIRANQVYQVTIAVNKMAKFMSVGITDSKYCCAVAGKSWIYYGNSKYCWDGVQQQGKYQGGGFKQGDVITMTVNLKYKTIQWRVNGQLECSNVIAHEQNKVAWVPYINLVNEGDNVSLYQ